MVRLGGGGGKSKNKTKRNNKNFLKINKEKIEKKERVVAFNLVTALRYKNKHLPRMSLGVFLASLVI